MTDRDGELLAIEADHRRHAVVEQVIADLKGGCGLAHLPSGRFAANAGWLALVGLAYNLGRWCAALTNPRWRTITTATLRTRLLAVPARIVQTARRLHLRLPRSWPWEADYQQLRAAPSSPSPDHHLPSLRKERTRKPVQAGKAHAPIHRNATTNPKELKITGHVGYPPVHPG